MLITRARYIYVVALHTGMHVVFPNDISWFSKSWFFAESFRKLYKITKYVKPTKFHKCFHEKLETLNACSTRKRRKNNARTKKAGRFCDWPTKMHLLIVPGIRPFLSGIRPDIRFHLPDKRLSGYTYDFFNCLGLQTGEWEVRRTGRGKGRGKDRHSGDRKGDGRKEGIG